MLLVQRDYVGRQGADIRVDRFDVQLPSFDLREIENIVDQSITRKSVSPLD
jgi:hypothetical protein